VSNWQSEARLTGRYALAGLINTAVGMSVLFALTYFGVGPVIANLLGYMCGLVIGFSSAKSFVFRSGGRVSHEALRYLIAFAFSYLLNIVALLLAIYLLGVKPLLAQVFAVACYIVSMFLCSRWFVFRAKEQGKD
jgi:putative flippase GtrA